MDNLEKKISDQIKNKKKSIMKNKKFIILGIIAIIGLILTPSIFSTVEKSTYQIKQAAITGTMSVKMTPGIWLQTWGDIEEWPKAETFFFTQDKDTKDDVTQDNSIKVRFNDGSICNLSGTLRIIMPTSESDAIGLVTNKGHKTYDDLEQKLILPTVRNVLRLTSNLMSARESYKEKRTDFIFWASDQIQNGLYQTTETTQKVKDLISGEMVTTTVKVIKTINGKIDGQPTYQKNPLEGTGIKLVNFEIKDFDYANKVKQQIAEQQNALMAVATAKARAQEAEQDKLTITAQGAARVEKARYKELEVKAVAVVQAQRDKEVAETHAKKELEVAKLQKEAAKENKQKNILEGQGIAEKKRLIMSSDGALKAKLGTIETINKFWADAYANRKVPSVYMSGGVDSGKGSGPDDQFKTFMNMMNIKVAKELSVDLQTRGLEKTR